MVAAKTLYSFAEYLSAYRLFKDELEAGREARAELTQARQVIATYEAAVDRVRQAVADDDGTLAAAIRALLEGENP